MNVSDHAMARRLLAEVWQALGGDVEWLRRVQFSGDGALRSPFAVTDIAAASFASAGLALSELLAASGASTPEVRVDRRLASGWFDLPIGPSQPVKGPPVAGHSHAWMAEYQTADGRWIRLQATFPTLRARVARALGTAEDPAAFAEVIGRFAADEIEQILVDSGAAVAASRSVEEWLAHPQGVAVGAEPIVALEVGSKSDTPWEPTAGRPLAGIRVLDMTRVVSGPMATRFLAACGAEVLRLEAPGSDESIGMLGKGTDINLGKRWAFLDIKTNEGRAQFMKLLAGADVFVHGYRPGALEGLGIGEDVRRAVCPGLVEVTLNAYGWTGTWQHRRGFDTLVQFSTGLANDTTAWALADPQRRVPINALGRLVDASRPRHLPVEVLDFATGYQAAAAALKGLTRRLVSGHGSVSKLSLARTAAMLVDAGHVPEASVIELPLDGPYGERIYSSGMGPVRHLDFPVAVEGNPFFWERPFEVAGASTPTWSTVRPA